MPGHVCRGLTARVHSHFKGRPSLSNTRVLRSKGPTARGRVQMPTPNTHCSIACEGNGWEPPQVPSTGLI